jgi:hypothetical protein
MKPEVILGCVMGRAEQRERNNDIEVSCTVPIMEGLYGGIALSSYFRPLRNRDVG